jgi:hypothetical protein
VILIFLPFILLFIQIGAVWAVGFSSRRLTWITAAVLGMISPAIIVLLSLFLPVQMQISIWKPEEIFSGAIALQIGSTEWKLLIMLFLVHFSAIAYFPSRLFINSAVKYIYPGITFFAIGVLLSENILTLVIGLLLYDIFVLLVITPVNDNASFFANNRNGLFLTRIAGPLMLLAFVFMERHFFGNPALEVIGATLVYLVILTRILSTPYPNKPHRIEMRPRAYEYFINATISLCIIGKQFLDLGTAYAHVITLLIGLVFFLFQIPKLRLNSPTGEYTHGFTIALASLTFISMHLHPFPAAENLPGSMILLLAGAGSVFLVPFFTQQHVPALLIFGLLLLGFPAGSPADWQGVWTHLMQTGSNLVFILLLPVTIGILVFSLYRYLGNLRKRLQTEEIVELAFMRYVPYLIVFATLVIGFMRPLSVMSWRAWLFTMLVFPVIGFLFIIRSRILLIKINDKLNPFTVLMSEFVSFADKGSISMIRMTNEVERFVEGENSLLWIIFLISALALIMRG